MDRKKILQELPIFLVLSIIIAGSIWGIKIYLREQNPTWYAAKQIYRVHTALQTLDEDWKLESLSEVHPFEITSPYGSISYYCCITSYLIEEPEVVMGLNTMALSQVVDIDKIEKSTICSVNGSEAIWGEIEDKVYLCWTISPKYSCVLEYDIGMIPEEDILRIAESVEIPEK